MARKKLPTPEPPNPSGLCMCGCGNPAPIATETSHAAGLVQGHPSRYIRGHRQRTLRGRGADFLGPEYIIDENGCWVWQHGRAVNGKYGRTKSKHYSHRVYYEKFVGPIPKGLSLDHLCQNTLCCNPDHLEPVTKGENNRRAREAEKGSRPPVYPTSIKN